MKIENLRIGNYVKIDKQVYTVTEIKGSGFITALDNDGNSKIDVSVEQVRPVLITMSWLDKLNLKVSFENENYSIYDFGNSSFGLTYDYAKGLDKFNITFEGNAMSVVNYVHEMQNLYSMLCK